MAGSPPVDPKADKTGAGGLGGGNVYPKHEMHYTGKWPYGPITNPLPDPNYLEGVELHAQTPATGEGIFDDMFPFKLQFFTDDDPESDTFGERKLRIYTGRLTAMINTFTYSRDKDTVYSYTLTVEECTGGFCSTPDNIPGQTFTTTQGSAVGGADTSVSHTHQVTVSGLTIPDHKHLTSDPGEDPICALSSPASSDIDNFFTIGGQPTIKGPVQIEPSGFSDVLDADGLATGFRAQTLPDTYGKVWLEWQLDTSSPAGSIENIVTNVKISMTPHVADDPNTVADESDNDKENDPAGALTVTGNAGGVTATRANPKTGTYYLHIGTAYDPDEVVDANDEGKSIQQVIYENVYYSPLILPEDY